MFCFVFVESKQLQKQTSDHWVRSSAVREAQSKTGESGKCFNFIYIIFYSIQTSRAHRPWVHSRWLGLFPRAFLKKSTFEFDSPPKFHWLETTIEYYARNLASKPKNLLIRINSTYPQATAASTCPIAHPNCACPMDGWREPRRVIRPPAKRHRLSWERPNDALLTLCFMRELSVVELSAKFILNCNHK